MCFNFLMSKDNQPPPESLRRGGGGGGGREGEEEEGNCFLFYLFQKHATAWSIGETSGDFIHLARYPSHITYYLPGGPMFDVKTRCVAFDWMSTCCAAAIEQQPGFRSPTRGRNTLAPPETAASPLSPPPRPLPLPSPSPLLR